MSGKGSNLPSITIDNTAGYTKMDTLVSSQSAGNAQTNKVESTRAPGSRMFIMNDDTPSDYVIDKGMSSGSDYNANQLRRM